MGCKCGPACVALRSSLNRAFPGRSIASDGCCASSTHTAQNPRSDHEPDASGYAAAYDVTHDPGMGVDCGRLAERLKNDRRTNYLIYNARIWSRARAGEGWRPYSGVNAHRSHLHVSVFRSMVLDTTPWQVTDTAAPSPPPLEDDMAVRTFRSGTSGPEHAYLHGRHIIVNADEKAWLVQAGYVQASAPLDLAPIDVDYFFGPVIPRQAGNP